MLEGKYLESKTKTYSGWDYRPAIGVLSHCQAVTLGRWIKVFVDEVPEGGTCCSLT